MKNLDCSIEKNSMRESIIEKGGNTIDCIYLEEANKWKERRESLRKHFIEMKERASRKEIDGSESIRAWHTAEELSYYIVAPCIQLSTQLRKNAQKYMSLPIIKDLNKCDLIKWMEDFLDLSQRKQWSPEEMKTMLVSFIKNKHTEEIKDLPADKIVKYLIQEKYRAQDLEVYKEKLEKIKEIECKSLEQYIERFAYFFSFLEVISVICEAPGITVEQVDLFGRKKFYDGLMARNKKVLFYMKAQSVPLKDMIKYLLENKKIATKELEESGDFEKIQYHKDLSAKTVFPKKGDPNKHKCVLHPKGNHFENECKLKKKIKQFKKQSFPS